MAFARFMAARLSGGPRGERWVVVQLALLALIAIAPGAPFRPFNAAGALVPAGALLVLWSAVALGPSLTPFPAPAHGAREVYAGPYRYVRHPIYCGVLLACLGFAIATASPARLALVAVLVLFFDRKARMEERRLRDRYAGYAAYCARVKRFVPWVY